MNYGVKVVVSFITVLAISAGLVVFVVGRSGIPSRGRHAGASDGPRVVIEDPKAPTSGTTNDGAAEATPAEDPLAPDYKISDLGLPSFELIDHTGAPITNAAFNGKVTIVDFFFTRCTFICPMLTGQMLSLADSLKGTPVRFMSISVDSTHDTPEVLARYARDHGMDLTRWTLVSGNKDAIWGMLRSGLKWGIEERPEQQIPLAGGASMANIAHPSKLFLFGPDGKLLMMASADQDEEIARLEKRARAAAAKVGGK
jgi:cytochrome oxidase Cu insertion factor (SCO1/SenC/PrrC family)